MGWPYHLLDLTQEQKHERRLLLDRYGVYAQLSALIPILAYQLYRLAVWVYSERQRSKVNYAAIPSSPTLKQKRTTSSGSLAKTWRSTAWWLESEIATGWGLRGQWIAAGVWVSWLLFLCIHKTGEGKILSILTLCVLLARYLLARPMCLSLRIERLLTHDASISKRPFLFQLLSLSVSFWSSNPSKALCYCFSILRARY